VLATSTIVLYVKLSERERRSLERIAGAKVLPDARLEVRIQVEVKKKEH
jgi:hypothetical protein